MPLPAFTSCQIGDFQVTALSDGNMAASLELLSGIEMTEAHNIQHRAGINDPGNIHIHGYLIRGRGRTILIDAGTGGLNNAGGQLRETLSTVGVQSQEVDSVLLTHGHPDHLGGLLDTDGRPIFNNARLYIHPLEAAYWKDDTMMALAIERRKRNFLLARSTLEAYEERLYYLREDETIEGITPVWLPGHTPGHTGFRIDSAKSSLMIWGDIVHFPHIQTEQPLVSIEFDCDPVLAAKTRKRIMAQVSEQQWLVAGMHFAKPGFAHLRPDGEGYQLVYIEG
jgi:glyoxylase-like metal-dependent hydrolase (beta-lactamase superfamily II)